MIARNPDGIFLSNGPGDPAHVADATEIVQELLGTGIPLFGICLGHQILGRALGGTTVKLPFGHHGANHPVKDLTTGKIEITSQNHNFAVAIDSLAAVAELTHVNLNDGVCEGLAGQGRQRLQRAAPPRGRPRPSREQLPVRPLRRTHGAVPRRRVVTLPGSADARAHHRPGRSARRRGRCRVSVRH